MARFLKNNPSVLGRDMVDLAWLGIGVALAGAVNDKIVAPLAARIIPQSLSSEPMGKILDAVTTIVSAWGIGEVGRMAYRPAAAPLVTGGAALGIAKGLSILVPGYSLTGTLPGAVLRYIPSFVPRPAQVVAPINAPALMSPTIRQVTGAGTTGL